MDVQVTVQGLDKVVAKLDGQKLFGPPMKNFFTRATLALKEQAMAELGADGAGGAGYDTGHLLRSHATDVDPSPLPRWGVMGTNVPYGVYVHEGTRPHFPPPTALLDWVHRHHMAGAESITTRRRAGNRLNQYWEDLEVAFLIARHIAKYGTKANPWMRRAMEKSIGKLEALVGELASEVEARWRA